MSSLARFFGRSKDGMVIWLDTNDLSEMLAGPSPPLVIDVREPDEFTGELGHIHSARNVPLGQIPAQATALLAEQRPLVFVCHTDKRSAAAAQHLRLNGGASIAVLRGGMVAWQSRSKA